MVGTVILRENVGAFKLRLVTRVGSYRDVSVNVADCMLTRPDSCSSQVAEIGRRLCYGEIHAYGCCDTAAAGSLPISPARG